MVEGVYYDPSSAPDQELLLQPTMAEDAGISFSDVELA